MCDAYTRTLLSERLQPVQVIGLLNKMSPLKFVGVSFIINLFHLISAQQIDECACKLDLQQRLADCSELGLTHVSQIFSCVPNNTRQLILSNNNLEQLQSGIFERFVFLQILKLDNNGINRLNSGIFKNLTQLDELWLNYNNLNRNDSYAEDVFKPLRNLRRLYLQGNCNVHTSVCLYPDNALSALTTLLNLHLDGIPNGTFGAGFEKLRSLNTLYFDDDDDNGYSFCYMPVLTENTFEPFRKTPLSNLYMHSCNTSKLAPNTFSRLSNLTNLTIAHSAKLCPDSFENATVGLNDTNIKTLRFYNCCKRAPFYHIISEENFKNLKNTTLKVLDLGTNNIVYIDPSAIDHLPVSLEYFSLRENHIGKAGFMKRLYTLENLKVLDGSYQNHYTSVMIKSKAKISSGLPGLGEERVFKGNYQSVSQNITQKNTYNLPKRLEKLYMNNIKFGYPVPSMYFEPNKLRYLNLSSCMFIAFLGPWYGLTHLQILDISNNRFSFFHPKSLIDMGNLTSLYLQHNEIGEALTKDINSSTFASLRKLTRLDLSDNIIKDLPDTIFKNQINLRSLYLANNSLQSVSFMLKSMAKLRHLDVSHNEIEYISEQNMEFLDQIAANVKLSLDLSGNKLACTCNNLAFVHWLMTTKVNIIQKPELTCLYINKTRVSLSDLEFIYQQLKYECSSWIVITSSVIIFVCFLLLFTLLASLYYKRWQLRYLWYIGRVNIDPFHLPDDQEKSLLETDAYISYEHDYSFRNGATLHQVITDKIYPFFEEREYILNMRDEFYGNANLCHVIPKAIRKSRKIIAILTPSYCKDKWNTFEFNIAAYEGIYTKRNIIIPVLIDGTSENHLTPEIRTYILSKLKSNDVLRFPPIENEADLNAFSEKLEVFIRQDRPIR